MNYYFAMVSVILVTKIILPFARPRPCVATFRGFGSMARSLWGKSKLWDLDKINLGRLSRFLLGLAAVFLTESLLSLPVAYS